MIPLLFLQPPIRTLIPKQPDIPGQVYRVGFEIPGVQGGPEPAGKFRALPAMMQILPDTQVRILHFHLELRFWFVSSELHPLHLPVRKQEVREQFTPHFPISTGKESIRNNQQ